MLPQKCILVSDSNEPREEKNPNLFNKLNKLNKFINLFNKLNKTDVLNFH